MEEKKCEQIGLISELMQGRELTKQLCDHLFSPPSSPSPSSLSSSPSPSPSPSSSPSSSPSHIRKEVLIEKILSSIEKAINMIESKANNVNMNNDFHCSNGSPKSEVEDSEFKHKHVSKKRKTMNKWTEQVKVYSETALEGSLNDGYSWRKYGQKDILGAKFPRGYYRCTHRNVQGCLATKQVQKSDEDPKIYEITYKGRHTCTQSSHLNKTLPSKTKFVSQENKQQKNQPQQEEKIQSPQENFFSFGSQLQVKIEDFENKEDIFPSFSFENEDNNNNNIFSQTMIDNNFMESFSPTFMSPTTSESNMFCFSPCHFGNTGLIPSVQTSESSDISISDIVSVSDPNSVTNSPIDLDVFFNYDIDFDMDFLINTEEHCYAIDQ